jgi:CRISPR-associated protein Csh2
MSEILKERSELLFCYDIKDANPNGDPLDENKPRIDEETGINIVTDVRLKRTIRDYLYEYKGYNTEKENKDIFVRDVIYDKENGYIQTGKKRAENYDNLADKIISTCIDIRLFGGVIPLEKDSITYTGPVQFKMGRSLHPVELKHIKGTGAFASKNDSKQKTFREEYILPYSFITFHGIVNEIAAKHTGLTDGDVLEMLEAMWKGTANLISRSKYGQMPRLLIKVVYNESGYFIGDLEKKIKISNVDNPMKIRDIKDFELDISILLNDLEINKDKILKIEYKSDKNLRLNPAIPGEWNELNI